MNTYIHRQLSHMTRTWSDYFEQDLLQRVIYEQHLKSIF